MSTTKCLHIQSNELMEKLINKYKLTKVQTEVLQYLMKNNIWHTPTEIGKAFGKDYNSASFWACKKLKVLVTKKIVKKSKLGYKQNILYKEI